MYSRIKGTGSYLPLTVRTNADLEKMVDTSDEWITTRTGIHERRIAGEGDTCAHMAVEASRKAIEASGVSAEDIDQVIAATTSSEYACPSVACLVQKELGLRQVPAFDLAAACSGFVYGLVTADSFIKSGNARTVLVIGVDAMSRTCDPNDRSTIVLFGDGAGAAVVQADDETGILFSEIASDGAYSTLLSLRNPVRGRPDDTDYYLHMKGNEVFRFAVNTLSRLVVDTVQKAGFREEDLDWLVPHQANLRIISATAKKLKMDMDRVIVTLDRHGNTSAGSVALALDEGIRDGRIKKGNLLLLEAFGSGFTWGSVLLRY